MPKSARSLVSPSHVVGIACIACIALAPRPALASPPSPALVASTTPASAQWVAHEVLPGERLTEIADRYAVSTKSIARWNKLDAADPHHRAGQKLRVYTQLTANVRERLSYQVRPGDSWAKIADRFAVPQRALQRRWNRGGTLKVGQSITVWVEAAAREREQGEREAALPLVSVPGMAQSVGTPDRGRLINGIPLPENEALYSIRNPKHSYGSSHAIDTLQRSIADFRKSTGFSRQLLIADMSRQDGGRFGPHHSHRSGRDVDIALPLRADPSGLKPGSAARFDWTATFGLIKSLVATGEVRYIFLSRSRQALLYRAAKADGASSVELDPLIQFPRHGRSALVRHSRGHTSHLHVRFRCGPEEATCQEL